MARSRTRRGEVVEFDDPAGLGVVVDEVDGRRHPFHCTAISDGSRSIAVGTQVLFALTAAGGGRWEATAVRDLKSPTSPDSP